jgi:hypoxanthine phosphoribosyltransferase
MRKKYADKYEIVISEEELRERIAALGSQISEDFAGRPVHCICVLENSFLFVADLIRKITGEVRCQFVKPSVKERSIGETVTTEIFFAPEVDVEGQHVLLCEGIISTGQTTDFLARTFLARGAASVAICTLLDCPDDRCIDLEIAYHGFQVGPQWLAGFGLGSPMLNRNLPFIIAYPRTPE